MIAHLSLWQSTKMVAFYALVLVAAIALTAALLLNPEWGIAIAALGSLGD